MCKNIGFSAENFIALLGFFIFLKLKKKKSKYYFPD